MKRIILFLLVSLFCVPVMATPPIWESSFGSVISGLTGDDDDEESVSLSFSFPFDGSNYTTVWVGTNGGLQLGSRGDDGEIDYENWEYMEQFVSDNAPFIAGFSTDLDLSTDGTIHFNDFGDRAVFTWNEVGTNDNETAHVTFQIQLFDTGKIVLGYDGVLDDSGEDLIDDLDSEGIVVGITAGGEPTGTEPGPSNLSAGFTASSAEIYDRWCYDTVDSCGYNGNDEGWPGPINTDFDLDQKNVVFTPSGSGFIVNGGTAALPPIWETSFGAVLSGLTGNDDDEESVSLSFSFPFDGSNYTTIWVGDNGGLQLGSLGSNGDIDYDNWQSMNQFVADGVPSIAGFSTDLDLSTTGTIHFNDFGDRAVFTWDEVGTNQDETALVTFQIQLFDTGKIVLGYNGVLDGSGEDLIDDLDNGIVVGITAGGEPSGTESGPTDLSAGVFTVNSTEIYDRWCFNIADSCGFNGDNGLPGAVNTAFDLDGKNVVFTPSGDGFAVSNGIVVPDVATFHVTKDFVPNNSMGVEVFISCNDGLPLTSSQVITENSNGVTFIVERFTQDNLDCEITEAPVPGGYNASYAASIVTGATGAIGNTDGCQFESIVGGDFACAITNTAQDATFEVSKVWDLIGEGGDLIAQETDLTISCTEEILAASPSPDSGPNWVNGRHTVRWLVLQGDTTVTVTVNSANGTASCRATETIFTDAVEIDNPCSSDQGLTMGQTTSCTITNTVFFEGVPALNPYGLALMVLLMLGIGAVGFRRI